MRIQVYMYKMFTAIRFVTVKHLKITQMLKNREMAE